MKKILLLFIIMAIFPFALSAQDESSGGGGGGFFLGAKAAIGMVKFESTISNNEFAEESWDNPAYGIMLGYSFGNLSIQVEGIYSQYGANKIVPSYIYSSNSPVLLTYNSNTVLDHVDMDLYNVDIPLLLKYTPRELGFSPYFYIGANWGINIQATTTIVKTITTSEVVYRKITDDITDRVQYYDISPVAGIGIKMDAGKLTFFGDLRYKYGIMNLSNIDNGLGFTDSALWFSAGFFINF